eukprot:TRINITY_DN3601_c0_g1_i5.p1 TRINITY_DN3601_c0_g1~~TRINITY_DN3601_c0_g1_i5.p1  ORF type:complete len:245 (+),score=41.78 TRINITY_DN3601_c0_g1_i5:140-874(+)
MQHVLAPSEGEERQQQQRDALAVEAAAAATAAASPRQPAEDAALPRWVPHAHGPRVRGGGVVRVPIPTCPAPSPPPQEDDEGAASAARYVCLLPEYGNGDDDDDDDEAAPASVEAWAVPDVSEACSTASAESEARVPAPLCGGGPSCPASRSALASIKKHRAFEEALARAAKPSAAPRHGLRRRSAASPAGADSARAHLTRVVRAVHRSRSGGGATAAAAAAPAAAAVSAYRSRISCYSRKLEV